MNVSVLLFGPVAEELGHRVLTAVELEPGARVADLLEGLAQRHPALTSAVGSLAVAVNAEYRPRDHVLEDGDEVALIPPVSGG